MLTVVVKGVEELVNEFTTRGNTAGFMSTMIAILYFLTIYGLERLGSSTVWKPWFRGLLADYAYVVCIPGSPNLQPTHTYRSGPSSG
jgi:hypothetical protein